MWRYLVWLASGKYLRATVSTESWINLGFVMTKYYDVATGMS